MSTPDRPRDAIGVFAPGPEPGNPDDPLVCTRWIADRTIEALRADRFEPRALLDGDATRAGLQAAMPSIAGVAMCSHGNTPALRGDRAGAGAADANDEDEPRPGRPDLFASLLGRYIKGADGPALDRDNLDILAGRWIHALACHSSTELAAHACERGAACFAGYNVSLLVDWSPDELPPDAARLLAELVTQTTRVLAAGERDEDTIRASVRQVALKITRWCLDHPQCEAVRFLQITAHQLHQRLQVVRGTPPTERD